MLLARLSPLLALALLSGLARADEPPVVLPAPGQAPPSAPPPAPRASPAPGDQASVAGRMAVIDLDETLTAQRTDEVQVRGEPRATMAGGTVLRADDLRAPAPQSVADAVRYQGGVAVQQTSPGQSTIYLRGLSGREVLHIVDGVRVNATIFRAGNNPYLALIDPYSLARLELVRGPSSVLHGSDALGGAVIGTTRLPSYSDRPHTQGSLYQSFGTNPVGTATRADLEHGERTWAVRLGVTHYGAGDIRPGGGERSPVPSSWSGLERPVGGAYTPVTSRYERGTAFDMYAADAALRLRLVEGMDLVLRGSLAYRPELGRYDEIAPRFKRDYPASADSALRPLSRWAASATIFDRRTDLPYDELLVTLSWQRLDERLRRRGHDESCVDAGDGCTTRLRLTPSSRLRRETNISDAVGLRAETRWSWPRSRLGARLGAEVHHDRVQSESSSVRSGAAGDAITPDPSRYPDGSSQTQAGLFGQLDLDLTRRLHVHAGARAALFALAIRERVGDDPSPAFSSTLLDGTFSAGLRWEFVDHLALVATAGRAVRAPNVQDFASLGPRAGDRFQLPNDSIRPEHSLGADVGLRVRLHRVRADLTAFALRYQDAIVLAPATLSGSAATADGLGYVRSENASRVDFVGIESDLSFSLTPATVLYLRALAMRGTQHNDASTGLPATTPADRTPPPTLTAGLHHTVSTVRLDAFVHARARQDRLNDPTNLDDNRIPVDGTPGYATLHLAARAPLTPRLTTRLSLDNLTNALVLDHGSGFYRPGFSATAALTVRTD